MLDNFSEIGMMALQSLWISLHFLFSYCFLAVLELWGISPLP